MFFPGSTSRASVLRDVSPPSCSLVSVMCFHVHFTKHALSLSYSPCILALPHRRGHIATPPHLPSKKLLHSLQGLVSAQMLNPEIRTLAPLCLSVLSSLAPQLPTQFQVLNSLPSKSLKSTYISHPAATSLAPPTSLSQ